MIPFYSWHGHRDLFVVVRLNREMRYTSREWIKLLNVWWKRMFRVLSIYSVSCHSLNVSSLFSQPFKSSLLHSPSFSVTSFPWWRYSHWMDRNMEWKGKWRIVAWSKHSKIKQTVSPFQWIHLVTEDADDGKGQRKREIMHLHNKYISSGCECNQLSRTLGRDFQESNFLFSVPRY